MGPHQKKTDRDRSYGEDEKKKSNRGGRSTVLFNYGLSIMLFVALVQVFDPTKSAYHEKRMAHHAMDHSPIAADLATFTHGLSRTVTDEDSNPWKGRERIQRLLEEAGVANTLSRPEVEKLPKWEKIVELYGKRVVIVGKDECSTFRSKVPPNAALLGVAGLFNTGTNLLDSQIRKNIQTTLPNLWQVPWGKHRMAEVRGHHTAEGMEQYNTSHVLPIVIIRDPFAWLQSMCSHPYATSWRHGKHHCPNLVPDANDHEQYKNLKDVFQVTVKFDGKSHYKYKSLIHLWGDWYRQYLEAPDPVLMIRFEDLVFQPVQVLNEIAECVGGKLKTPIQYQVKSSKAHGSGTDYVKALIKTADAEMRPRNMTRADLDFVRSEIDRELLDLFQYRAALYPLQ